MTKQEIIDALDVARRMQGLMEQLPETLLEAHNQMSDAVSEILCDVVDAEDAIDIILQALKAEVTPPVNARQLQELAEENARLRRELKKIREAVASALGDDVEVEVEKRTVSSSEPDERDDGSVEMILEELEGLKKNR